MDAKTMTLGELTRQIGGELVGDASVGANPRAAVRGEAPALVRLSSKAGKVRVTAAYVPAGSQMPERGVLEFDTTASKLSFLQDELPQAGASAAAAPAAADDSASLRLRLDAAEKALNRLRNREVEKQQGEFEHNDPQPAKQR